MHAPLCKKTRHTPPATRAEQDLVPKGGDKKWHYDDPSKGGSVWEVGGCT